MFYCKYCDFKTPELEEHVRHRSGSHRHVSKYIVCGFEQCSKVIKNEPQLRKHLLTSHGLRRRQEIYGGAIHPNNRGKFVCNLDICRRECDTFPELLKHLRIHLSKKIQIKCPIDGCDKKYKLKSSFASHISKNHRQTPYQIHGDQDGAPCGAIDNQMQIDEEFNQGDESEENANVEYNLPNPQCGPGPDRRELTDPFDLFLQNVAQFCLKLETVCHIPARTIGLIVSEMTHLHGESQDILKEKLDNKFLAENVAPEKIIEVYNEVFDQDPLKASYKHLKTDYLRKKFYKTQFSYIQPRFIDIDEAEKKFFAYIPIIETLDRASRDVSMMDDLKKPTRLPDEGYFHNFRNGSLFKNNKYFKENPEAFKIILYQDEFEVVNPIGPARKKHKLLAVYMNIADLSDHLHSHVNTMKLVALCKSTDFDHKTVFSPIVEDLKKLESGVEINGQILKGALVWISGDNLGSHGLGGFIENFSTAEYLCRFCLITRKQFERESGATRNYTWRTADSYTRALDHISETEVDSHEGIKFNSIFNDLEHYHVCTGLPPCLGHDIFEGVVAYDVILFLNSFISKKWITLKELNHRIDTFPYSAEDRCDKPCTIQKLTGKLTGGACQIWNFLRILPILIGDKIDDYTDDTWRCLLLLGEIVEIICSPTIHKSCIPYLDTLIQEYLYLRELSFPDHRLRPKHHYLTHYPQLILLYGPLIKVWTLRYESKHKFFKKTIRTRQNFKNVVKTASEKHELLQSYICLGADARLELDLGEFQQFNINLYHEDIANALRVSMVSENIEECSKLVYRGTDFKKGYALTIRHQNYHQNVVLGRICKILSRGFDCVYLLVEIVESEFIPYLRAHKIYGCKSYECIPLQNLVYQKPMPVYKWKSSLYTKPKYGLVSQPLQSLGEDMD
ncbi:hypothetical protein QAD02_002826 [Eretmocerus hayati]|uniref:Uncharacterized protein n=1 Tax=Eretmocerus hayati TaxID=131215 RepID=A0ACC2NKD9_9HYME|nr:hypothetical protein QAD02_002826 [Eretmocerus hayati]